MKIFNKKIIAILASIAILSYVVYVYFNPPNDIGVHIACVTYTVFGIYCAGCGMTRQAYYLLHGEFYNALMSNVLGIIIIPCLILIYIVYMRWAILDKEFPEIPLKIVIIYVSILSIYSVLRNIPFLPFTYLAPFIPS